MHSSFTDRDVDEAYGISNDDNGNGLKEDMPHPAYYRCAECKKYIFLKTTKTSETGETMWFRNDNEARVMAENQEDDIEDAKFLAQCRN